MRPLSELINRVDPGWVLVKDWLKAATNHVEVLPHEGDSRREQALLATQVTTRSPMGAIIYESGGILVDHGFLRILGSGSPRLPRSLPSWNDGRTGATPTTPTFLLIADDVLGGFFAVDGGALGIERGQVAYFSPHSLQWEGLGVGYSGFIQWCFSGDLDDFYGDDRWPGWEKEVAALGGDQALNIYPPLFTQGPPLAARTRKSVSIAELFDLHINTYR